MEPRARAGKNVGKMNFSYQELTQFLIAHGDSRQPLPETIRVLDEILTEFIQGVSFEATRVAQLAGRQKVKYEDFQFAMRKNPVFLGKAAENKELREIIDKQRRVFNEDEMIKEDVAGAAGGGAAAAGSATGRGRKRESLSTKGSSSTTSGPMPANNRQIAAGTMNITGCLSTNAQVLHQDLETTDLLYRLVWDDKGNSEQRLALGLAPQQVTTIAVTTTNITSDDGIQADVFYLSENQHNSSKSDICQATLGNSGLGSIVVSNSSQILVYYTGLGRSIRALEADYPAQNGWVDSNMEGQVASGLSISANHCAAFGTIQVIFASVAPKDLEELTYNDAAGSDSARMADIVSSAPSGWEPKARFSTCFKSPAWTSITYIMLEPGDINGLYRKDNNET
ncbi:Transcription initiation factor TFIID subunit 13 [Cytospora mali]|uniref:Transcription initiation factor TFIID subunit 13 n=1 Tax=Cytospora mali TaxID=578113 RepID=A0A194VTP1_CYTMA|nr:Transcription initiation factor TFIID subunit 13 [Valsa mali]